MISFLLIVNQRGQTRIRKYYPNAGADDVQYEKDIIRKCLCREDHMVCIIYNLLPSY